MKNTDLWPTIKSFLTNKGAKYDNTIMIRVDEKLIPDASQVSQHMNEFYVNIASTIVENINVSQKTEKNVDFVSMCANHFDKHPSIVDINNNINTTAFSFRHTTAATLETILRGLNVKIATCQDLIPPKLVKPAAGLLSHHLANIFNQYVDTGEFPDDAKWQRLCRCTKKDDNLNMKNYRGVSILPSMSKVLEKNHSPSDEPLSAGDA